MKRYKETRRSHPLAGNGRIDEGIRQEREQLKDLKHYADYLLDTSKLLTRELREELEKIFVENRKIPESHGHRAVFWIQVRDSPGCRSGL